MILGSGPLTKGDRLYVQGRKQQLLDRGFMWKTDRFVLGGIEIMPDFLMSEDPDWQKALWEARTHIDARNGIQAWIHDIKRLPYADAGTPEFELLKSVMTPAQKLADKIQSLLNELDEART